MRFDQFAFNGDLASQILGTIEHDTGLLKDRQPCRVGNIVLGQDLPPQIRAENAKGCGRFLRGSLSVNFERDGFERHLRRKIPRSRLLPKQNYLHTNESAAALENVAGCFFRPAPPRAGQLAPAQPEYLASSNR